VKECAERQSREGPGVAQYLKGLASTSR
jgi:hypothetical protein